MNNNTLVNGSNISHLQHSQPTEDTSSIVCIEISLQTLIKSCCKRQKYWQLFFDPAKQNLNNQHTWRTKLINFLESTPIRAISILLILLDLILTTLDLSSSLISCMPNKSNRKILAGYYHWVGIGILIILSTKTMALAIGLGSSFFRRPGYVVDGVMLSVALVMEVLLERKGGGLLVVVSLWRVIRVVESAFELSDQAIEAMIETIVCQFDGLREENRRLLEIIAEKDKIIQNLEEDFDHTMERRILTIAAAPAYCKSHGENPQNFHGLSKSILNLAKEELHVGDSGVLERAPTESPSTRV